MLWSWIAGRVGCAWCMTLRHGVRGMCGGRALIGNRVHTGAWAHVRVTSARQLMCSVKVGWVQWEGDQCRVAVLSPVYDRLQLCVHDLRGEVRLMSGGGLRFVDS